MTELLLGHENTLASLRAAIAGQALAHSLLVTGPDGVGKTTLALILARDLTCLEPRNEGSACQSCRSCVLADAGTHPDILRITPPKEETTIAQAREIRQVAGMVPALSERRVIIIERAETLNEQAANAILKVLEDAPGRLTLLLLAPSSKSVLATIRSRSLEVPLRPVSLKTLTCFLEENGLPPETSAAVARNSGGAPGRAIRLGESPDLLESLSEIRQWLETLRQAPPGAALKLAEELRQIAGRVKKLLKDDDAASDRQAVSWVLDSLMAELAQGLENGNEESGWSIPRTAAAIREINQCRNNVMNYASVDLQTERLLLRLLNPRAMG